MFKGNTKIIIVTCIVLLLLFVYFGPSIKDNNIPQKDKIILKVEAKGYKQTDISVFETISYDWDESMINIFIMDKKLDLDFKKGKGGNDYNKRIIKSLKHRMRNIEDAICFEDEVSLVDVFAIKKYKNITKELNQYEQLYYSQGFNIKETNNSITWYKKRGSNRVYFCCGNKNIIITGITNKETRNSVNELIIKIQKYLK